MTNYGKPCIRLENGDLIDSETGEIVSKAEHGIFITYEEMDDKNRKLADRNKRYDEIVRAENFRIENNKEYQKIEENFVWQYFTEQEKMFPDLKPQDIAKLLMAATYCEFGTNDLVDSRTNVNKSRLAKIIGGDSSVFRKWFDRMVDGEYLILKGEYVSINPKYFSKGMLVKNNNATRLFVDVFRNLYTNIPHKDHYKIGYILKLIPYLNPNFNVLAKNPREADINKLERFRMVDLANMLGVSKTNIRRLANELLSISYGPDDSPIIGLLALRSLDVGNMFIIMNTRLVFGGNFEAYQKMGDIFDNRLLEIRENRFSDEV